MVSSPSDWMPPKTSALLEDPATTTPRPSWSCSCFGLGARGFLVRIQNAAHQPKGHQIHDLRGGATQPQPHLVFLAHLFPVKPAVPLAPMSSVRMSPSLEGHANLWPEQSPQLTANKCHQAVSTDGDFFERWAPSIYRSVVSPCASCQACQSCISAGFPCSPSR